LKISPPANDLPPPLAAKGKAAGAEEEIEFSSKGSRIRLPLRNLLRGIPSFQLSGPTDEVPEATMIEFPFSIVEPQLALGRIAVSPAQFHGAIPAEFRNRFKIEDSATPISLPLQEVLQNLPNEALQIRGDQQEIEVLELIETPFSQKATEDATRMKVPTGPVVRPAVSFAEPEPEPAAAPAKKAPVAAVPKVKAVAAAIKAPSAATPEGRTALQKMLETDEALDAKAVVARASSLPGVSACAIVFSDGLSLAGNIPADYEADALCAIAPAIVKRIGEQMLGANLGSLTAVTLFCAKTPVSFFAHGNICLAALHSAGEIAAETRSRLGGIAQELARMYAESA
jgi:predicted regulator of Ras-like GTPase activity (Roadblock/LC7/MglB family)